MFTILVRLASMLAISIALSACASPRSSSALEAVYDEQTGKLSQVTLNKQSDGKPNIFSYMDGAKFLRIEIDDDEDGKIDRWEYYSDDQKIEKAGLSRSNDGILDAWVFQGPDGGVARVELSTRRDGRPNRVEFYESGQLVRAEEDTNFDGRADKWETFQNGSLTTVSFDTTGSGTPNHVIDYRNERAGR